MKTKSTKIKQKLSLLTLAFLLLAILFSGCEELTDTSIALPNCSGPVGEVLVVIDEPKWKNQVGDTIFSLLTVPFPMLPQNEPTFKPIHITHDLFKATGQTHRNIIFVNISDKIQKAKITVERNRWAKPQLVYRISAPNDEKFINLFARNSQAIIDTLLKEERERFMKLYRKYRSVEIEEALKSEHELRITCPSDYKLDVSRDNFVWISNETPKTSQGIFIYYYNYSDTSDFELHNLMAVRDSVTKRNVPGPQDNTWMTTEKLIVPEREVFSLRGKYACKVRGLWVIENYILGGPFVSVSIVDEKHNRIITADGYVYAGKQDKKVFLWQIEAILHSISAI